MKKISSSPTDPIYEFTLRIKLIFKLLKNPAVQARLKILPFLGIIYLFLPFKLLFPFDFLLVLIFGGYLFIEFSPPEIVDSSLKELRNVIPGEFTKGNQKEDQQKSASSKDSK
jgi:hypothetical protein